MPSRFLASVLLIFILVAAAPANITDQFDAYAPDDMFGEVYNLPGHIGVSMYTIDVRAYENTNVYGRVRFVGPGGRVRTIPFLGHVTFRTGPNVGMPQVQFMGQPYASPIRVRVSVMP